MYGNFVHPISIHSRELLESSSSALHAGFALLVSYFAAMAPSIVLSTELIAELNFRNASLTGVIRRCIMGL